jgi:twitching motility protein PilT
VPSIESLELPEVLTRVADSERGLVVVAGVSGSGRSSTVAALVHHINRTHQKHIVTIENPIEFLHRDLSCSVTQREVGVDTESLAIGVRAALRQDPDVVVISDMNEPETVDTALKAAETGRLVIATMSTPDVTTTVERIVATLPKEERGVARMRLSESVRAIIAQQLLPKRGEDGRAAVMEILLGTPAVRDCLRASDRLVDLKRLMADGGKDGMQTFEAHLSELVAEERVTAETAKAALIPTPLPGGSGGGKRGRQAANA